METKQKSYEIRRRRTEIDVPHAGNVLTVIHQKYGPGTYTQVQEAITSDGLVPPTMAEQASLVYAAFQDSEDKEPEFVDVKDIMNSGRLWGFTGTLYAPNEGAYVKDHPEVKDGIPFMDRADLVAKLEAKDSSVRFVPFGFKIDYMTPLELSKNPYVIALAGEEGAGRLAEIADKHKFKMPRLWSFKSVDQPLTRVSALGSGWGLGEGHGLRVSGDDVGCWDGWAFGVRRR